MKKHHIARQVMAFILCCVMMWTVLSPAYAIAQEPESENSVEQINYVDNTETVVISNEVAEEFTKFEVKNFSNTYGTVTSDIVTSSDILGICEEIDHVDLGGITIITYSSDQLPNMLYECHTIEEIYSIGNNVCITYITQNGMTVYLTYSEDGIIDKVIYDENSDIATYVSQFTQEQYINFRYGSYYAMTDEMVDILDEYIADGNIEALKEIEGLSITESDDGNIFIEGNGDIEAISNIELYNSARESNPPSAFTSQSELIADLKSVFPEYSLNVYTTTLNSTALGKNLDVKVYENRTSYTKVSASYRAFAVRTTVALIAAYLEISTAGTISLLSVLGLLDSTVSFIVEAVTLYRSARYSYTGSMFGYVYDPTIYHDYVCVKNYSSTGEFTGGYDSNDEWRWVRSSLPSAFDLDCRTIARDAMSEYNADVAANGYCSRFTPTGIYP